MTDFFALLNQPRRPWLDRDEVEKQFRELARTTHPDTGGASATGDRFAQLNEAYAVLQSTQKRLRHLSALEDVAAVDQPLEFGDLFGVVMNATRKAREEIARATDRDESAITRSVRLMRRKAATEELAMMIHRLEEEQAGAEATLRATDEMWESDRERAVAELRRLGARFTFLDRWLGQLRELHFALTT